MSMAAIPSLTEALPSFPSSEGYELRSKDDNKRLESLVFNHISLGQWEAARVCVERLATSGDQGARQNARELLKIVIIESNNYWSVSDAIPSPHHLSWLALSTYKQLFTQPQDKLPEYLQGLIEFRLLLHSCIGIVSFSNRVASQLCQYHAIQVLEIPGGVSDSVPFFSGLIVSFLHDVITTLSPALGHALITSLTKPGSTQHLPNNESLQLIYIECINDCLDLLLKVKTDESAEQDSSYDSQYESDHPTTGIRGTKRQCEKIVSKIYTLLSLLDPTQEMIKLTKKIDAVFHTLLKSSHTLSPDIKISFETGRIYACLLGRSTPFLINRLHEVEEYLRIHPEMEDPAKTQVGTPLKLSLQTVNAKELWRARFYEALYDHKHLLEGMLESGLQLVMAGQLQELAWLVGKAEGTPLRPLMLLMGWDKYPASGSGKELLNVLWPVEVSLRQQLLFNGCCKLAFQVELVQWCLEKAKPHLQRQSSFTVHRAGEMFKGLESHSTLFVLHHYTPLASLNPTEVIDILKMRPRAPTISAVSALTPPPQFSRGTTPLKPPGDSESPPLLSPVDSHKSLQIPSIRNLRPEQERDISIYRSFCAVRLVLDAVWSSVELTTGTSICEDSVFVGDSITESKAKAARKLDFGEDSKELLTGSGYAESMQYSDGVLDKLQEAKIYISQIEPLNYRLEILEDIFSLLFLTSSDIKPLSVRETKEAATDSKIGSTSEFLSKWGNEFSSAFSSIALIRSKAGFLIGEKITSDLLLLLQDCINELRAAKFQQQSTVDSQLGSVVKSAIPVTSLQQRSAQLEQYINEAKWRLQLISSKSGILATPSGKGTSRIDITSSSDDSVSERSDSEPEEEVKKERKRHRKPGIVLSRAKDDSDIKSPYRQSFNNSPDGTITPRAASPSVYTSLPVTRPSFQTGKSPRPSPRASPKPKPIQTLTSPEKSKDDEDDSGECADIEDRSPDSRSPKKRKRLRSRGPQAPSRKRRGKLIDQSEGSTSRNSFVCQMLSSPDSLLRLCVKHANYSRAKEVVNIFSMKGEFGEFFADFSQQYEIISKELGQSRTPLNSAKSSYSGSMTGSHTQTPPKPLQTQTPPKGTQTALETAIPLGSLSKISLQLAIKTATTSSEALESLHRLLAPSMVTKMLFSGDKALEKAAEESNLLQTLTEHVPTLVMLDIVCSSKLEPQIAKRIIELATSRSLGALQTTVSLSKRGSKLSQTHDVLSVGGPFGLLQMFSDVLGYFSSSGSLPQPTTLCVCTYSSPHSLLTSSGHHLQVDSIKNTKISNENYREAREKMERELSQLALQSTSDLFEELVQSSKESTTFSQQKSKTPVNLFDELIRALSFGKSIQSDVEEGAASASYLWQFVRYTNKLLECLNRCLGLGGAVPGKASLLLTVLGEPPTQALGRLLFERDIPPHKLEAQMEDFSHLQMVEVIIKCCCPQLPSASFNGPTTLSATSSIVALNGASDTESDDSVTDPCGLSYELLSNLIAIVKGSRSSPHSKDTIITVENLSSALDNPKLHLLFKRTKSLESIDLKKLDTNKKRIVFYSNIVNVLYIHALLMAVASEVKAELLGDLQDIFTHGWLSLELITSSAVMQTVYFTKVGYKIGQLGLISCYDLHHTILRQGLSQPTLVKESSLGICTEPQSSDPWFIHSPKTTEPRVLYVVHDGRITSPTPVALSVESFEDTLQTAETLYLSSKVSIDPNAKHISIPEWLFDCYKDFYQSNISDVDLALLKYMQSRLAKDKSDILLQIIEGSELSKTKKVNISIVPNKTQFGYNFSVKESTPSPKTSPSHRRPSRETSRRELPSPTLVKDLNQKHSFTPEIFTFVQQRSPLLAALIYLLSPPEAKTEAPTGNDKDPSEDQVEKKGILQSIKEKVNPKSPQVQQKELPTPVKPVEDWNFIFDDVLSHFVKARPMQQFLTARISGFRSLIQWDSTPGKPDPSNEFKVCVRTLAALPSSSPVIGEACHFVMKKLLETGEVMQAVDFMSSEPASGHPGMISCLSDLILNCAFELNCSKQTKDPLFILSQISNPELASRLTLSSLKHWPVRECIKLLSYCLYHLPTISPLKKTVKEKLDCMKVYLAMSNCKSPLHASKSPWRNWYQIATDSESNPDYVLSVLLHSTNFTIARQWGAVHKVDKELSEQIEVDYLSYLLEGETSDPIAAQQVLDNLSEDATALGVCESLLKHANLQVTIFVLHYMLSRLSHCLHYAKTQDYSNKLLGARALLCLPEGTRGPYMNLSAQPMLLVEQLLMDVKIDWAVMVIQQLRGNEHMSQIHNTDTPILDPELVKLPGMEDSQDPFLKAILFYCVKALEIPPAVYAPEPLQQSMATTTVNTMPPSPRTGKTTKPLPIPVEDAPFSGSMDYPPMTPRNKAPGMHAPYHRRRISTSSVASMDRKDGSFKPPNKTPTRDQWERDSEARSCPICKVVVFGMFNRRHHCRRCGRVVCAGCSTHLSEVTSYDIPVRVCDDCHNPQDTPPTPPTSSLPPFDHRTLLPGNDYPDNPASPLRSYVLIPKDEMYNLNVRTEFYYEKAPSTALFLSMVDLVTDKKLAAEFILDRCHALSLQLVPNAQGMVNKEVDHHFVIGLIQNLFQNAKVRFAQAEDSSGVELCDNYLSRVDLLRLLVSSQCPKIPSIQELTKPELARRVRDNLMQSNRFKLAMEVSTKCQLDTVDVMSVWGMACLKYGDYPSARSKFKNCFQVSSHSKLSSSSGHNLQLLQRIVEQIEQTPLAIAAQNSHYNEDWSSMLMSSMNVPERWSDECDLDKGRFSECVYYLSSYGTDSSLISFYVKHGCWLEACRLIKEKNCSTDLFLDHFWVPAMKTGQIDYVEDCLVKVDHTLSSWEAYLTAACRYFTQKGLFSVLYRTQLFMKDYIRAGMTCIKFFIGFSGRSTTIADLYSRLHYLSQAKKHFQTFLDAKNRVGERRVGRSRPSRVFDDSSHAMLSSVKSLPLSEVQLHLSTIEMQTRVTHFLYQSAESLHTVSDPLPHSSSASDVTASVSSPRPSAAPATLFSNAQIRGEVAIQLLTCSQDIIEGFEFAREIIQAYRLPPSDIYCGTARVLSLRQRYSDLRVLLQCLQKAHMSQGLNDDIIMAAVKVLANQPSEAKQIDKIVQLLTSEKSKIKAFVLCGKLKSAYLVAVKAGEVAEVREISELAGKAGQIAVRDICQKWLREHGHRQH